MLEDLPPSSSRSPQKRCSEEGNKSIFPHGICLFRDKKTTTSRVKMFKPTEIFTSWGHNKSGWKNIEQMARDLHDHGYSGLFRKVAGADLFAAEAHFHQSCHSKFYSKQVKHGRVIKGHIKDYIHNIHVYNIILYYICYLYYIMVKKNTQGHNILLDINTLTDNRHTISRQ